jgi:hypothetical protein
MPGQAGPGPPIGSAYFDDTVLIWHDRRQQSFASAPSSCPPLTFRCTGAALPLRRQPLDPIDHTTVH